MGSAATELGGLCGGRTLAGGDVRNNSRTDMATMYSAALAHFRSLEGKGMSVVIVNTLGRRFFPTKVTKTEQRECLIKIFLVGVGALLANGY